MVKGSKFKCKQDKNSGELVCNSFIENKDGTKTQLASLHARTDGECKPIITEIEEHYPGEFEKLEGKVINRLIGQCEKTPDEV